MIRPCLLVLEDSRFALLCLYTVSTASNIMVLRLVIYTILRRKVAGNSRRGQNARQRRYRLRKDIF